MKYGIMPYENIRNLRIDNHLTQSDVAQILHVKQNTYSQYEIGVLNYPIDVLVKLAYFYDTSIDYLVGITKDKRSYEKVEDNTHQILQQEKTS